jgi:hypothetical protein
MDESDFIVDERFDLDYLDELTLNGDQRYVITCPSIHLTYAVHFDGGLPFLIEVLRENLAKKNCIIERLSAVEETDQCRAVGRRCNHCHVALKMSYDRTKTTRFKIHGLDPVTVRGVVPHVRLVKDPMHWRHLWWWYHHKEGTPYQLVDGGVAVQVERRLAGQSRKAALQDVRALNAGRAHFDHKTSNTATLQSFLSGSPSSVRGGKHWVLHLKNAAMIADHGELEKKFVVFHNCWSVTDVVKKMQSYANRGLLLPVIFCYSGAMPEERRLRKLFTICEAVVTGTLYKESSDVGDYPLAMWRPHLYLYAEFLPTDQGLVDGNWTIWFQDPSGTVTRHMMVPASIELDLRRLSERYVVPEPVIISRSLLRTALSRYRERNEPDAFRSVEEMESTLYRFLSPEIMDLYWRAGFEPVLRVFADFFGEGSLLSSVSGQEVRLGRFTSIASVIGRDARLGNVLIMSVPLNAEQKETAARILRDRREGLEIVDELEAERIAVALGLPVTGNLVVESIPAAVPPGRRELLFQISGGPFPNFGTPSSTAIRELDAFLAGFNGRKGYSIHTPFGDVRSDGWIIESPPVIIEVDLEIPPKGEAYKMLRWIETGYRIIRVRQDDVGQRWGGTELSVELEHIIRRGYDDVYLLEREPGRKSWGLLREEIREYNTPPKTHCIWWREKVDPELGEDDYFTSLYTPRPGTPTSPTPEPIQQTSQPAPASAQGSNFDPPTPARIPTPDPTPAPHESVLAYLSGLDGLKITPNASIPPVSGEAATYTIQCLVVYSTDRVAVIEIDEAPPSSLDVYRTLLALHRGAKIIRLRAPDIRLCTFNWKEAIRNAIHGTGMIHLLQPPGQDYWRATFDTIVQWRTRHPTEWRDQCHKSAVKK